ncbi:MAG: polyphenol oxidase [Rhodobacterales bacterium]|nr:MAG: polyphenol oxidase [Rhodobacterales bacterium]
MTIDILTSDLLAPTPHGFFSRRGGVSRGIYAGLNCGFGSDDDSNDVAANRALVEAAMQVGPGGLVTVHQYHSNQVALIPSAAGECKADAMVSASPGVVLGILTADCAPILFADRQAGVIGAAHAGWQGALNGVIEATFAAMLDLGADKTNIKAAIGACISPAAYEVGPEFRDNFTAQDPDYARFFSTGAQDRPHFDLPGFCLHRLKLCGIAQAEWINHCTYQDAERFYSYRRSVHHKQPDYGRLISCIRL